MSPTQWLGSHISDGIVTLFVLGSTAALTTIEYEDGAVHDFQRLFDEIAAPERLMTTINAGGMAMVTAMCVLHCWGPSLTVPFNNQQLALGTWQQIIWSISITAPANGQSLLRSWVSRTLNQHAHLSHCRRAGLA